MPGTVGAHPFDKEIDPFGFKAFRHRQVRYMKAVEAEGTLA